MYPRGGLLGGSSRPSKLAQLAAARKKKEEDKQKYAQGSEEDRSISILDRLKTKKENHNPHPDASTIPIVEKPKLAFPSRPKGPPSPVRQAEPEVKVEEQTISAPVLTAVNIRARPSMFAQTIFGQETPSTGGAWLGSSEPLEQKVRRDSDTFSLPFVINPEYQKHNPFQGPSPDDIVLRAQSKGSAHT